MKTISPDLAYTDDLTSVNCKFCKNTPFWKNNSFPNLNGTRPDIYWTQQALMQDGIRNKGPKTYFGVKSGTLSCTLKEFLKEITDLQGIPLYQAPPSSPTDGDSYTYFWNCGAIEFTQAHYGFEVTYTFNDEKMFELIQNLCSKNIKKYETKGKAFVLVETNHGPTLEVVGIASKKLSRDNYSEEILKEYDHIVEDLQSNDPCGRIVLMDGTPGVGKCLGKDTPVLLYNGNIIPVQDIRVGDLLMGPDSRPRRVLSTNSGQGRLFSVMPTRGDPWICNDIHVLTLVNSNSDDVYDIGLDVFLKKSKSYRKNQKLFHVGVEFPNQKVPLNPYFMGVWFGDGTHHLNDNRELLRVEVSKPDAEIKDICQQIASEFDLKVRERNWSSGGCPSYGIINPEKTGNPLLTLMREILGENLKIPQVYLINDRKVRLEFLAGLLDTDGYLINNCFEITQKREDWAKDIAFLARSLGFFVSTSIKIVEGYGIYYRLFISGKTNEVPTRIPRKRANPRLQIKDPLRTGFSVESIGDGEYYGFTIDGDGRFLLGDFTVTHNTFLARGLMHEVNDTMFINIPANMLSSVTSPHLVKALMDNKQENRSMVLIVEDADACLVTRDLGTVSELSTLLNLTDGILGTTLDLRIIATTNAGHLTNTDVTIDEAVLRPGRLCRRIEIGKLSPEHASRLYNKLTKLERAFTEEMTLAEVYRTARDSGWKPRKERKKLGFNAEMEVESKAVRRPS